MTFESKELSEYSGEPTDLYTFNRDSSYWRYTSADEDKTVGGFIFSSEVMSRSGVERTQDTARNSIIVNTSVDLGFVQQYISAPPSDIVTLTIQRYHETDGDEELAVIWIGRVVNVKFFENKTDIRCEPVFTSIRRPMLRRFYQTTCPHVLYGDSCLLNRNSFVTNATASSVSGLDISSTQIGAFSDGDFTGGFIEFITDENNTDRRFITDHVGDTITINLQIIGFEATDVFKAYLGCDHTLSICTSKFSNELNYGGFPYIPPKNPVDGTTIY